MSLMLRKKCQTLLNDVGLNNYHTQIDPDSKMLQIVGECGQEFVSIAGIRLSRMAPNDKEMELAIELFEAFLVKHTGTFKRFLEAKAVADSCFIPKEVNGLLNSKVIKQNYQTYYCLSFTPIELPDDVVMVESNGEVSIPSRTIDVNVPNYSPLRASLTDEEASIILDWVNTCAEFEEATKLKEELLGTLSSCEI